MYVPTYNLMHLLLPTGLSIDEPFSSAINSDNFPIGLPNGVDLHDEWLDWDVDLWSFWSVFIDSSSSISPLLLTQAKTVWLLRDKILT